MQRLPLIRNLKMRDNILLTLAYLLFCLMLFSGCMTKNKFLRYGKEHPETAAEFCADEYPAKDSIIYGRTDTVTVTNTRTDSVTTTIVNEVTGETKIVKLPCPPCKETIKVVHKTDTIIRIDRAKEKVLIEKSEQEQAKREKAEKNFQYLIYITAGLGVAVIGLVFLRR